MALCQSCHDMQSCAELAQTDKYTGLAAGAAYNGIRKLTSAVPRNPKPSHWAQQVG